MPLVIITGIPSSGKTTRTIQICDYFTNLNKEVHVVSEEEQILKAGFDKNTFFLNSTQEKHIRGVLKSEVLKLIGPKSLVILDASNYIKGYRYELFCASKANKCTQCTVLTEINRDQAWTFNESRSNESEKYTKEVYDALVMRYESPEGKNRWDAPLFMIFPDEQLDMNALSECLFDKKPPAPNQSTQNAPLSATNFLYELDKITKEITDGILKAKNMGARGEVKIPGYTNFTVNVSNVTTPQLMILRRQYLTYSKMHAPEVSQIPQLYIQYLKTTIG